MNRATECIKNIPDGLVMPAAYCIADFDAICRRLDAHQAIRYITYSKKLKKPRERYRCAGLRLSNGRFATLLKEDREEYFEIWLQREGYGYALSEVEEIRVFIEVDTSKILRLDNGLRWIEPRDATISLPIMTMEIVCSEPWRSVLNRA